MPKKQKPEAISKMEAPDQPYSGVVQIGHHFHFSGIVAINEDKQPDGNLADQTTKVLQKMKESLHTYGLTANDVYSVEVFLADDMNGYGFLNKQWFSYFYSCEIKPRRVVVAVAALPFGCAIEIVFDAVKQSD